VNYFDVFNGDADGICALIQLRLQTPVQATLVTGVKRDNQLLAKLTAQPNDYITVLDIGLKINHTSVQTLLSQGAHIFYVDHHQAGNIPVHPHLTTLIDTDPRMCTSVLVNKHLEGRYPLWAIVAAFGDNLPDVAHQLAMPLTLSVPQMQLLKNLGTYVNYNSYGRNLQDLHFAPEQLYQNMVRYLSPFDFIYEQTEIFNQLAAGYHNDLSNVQTIKPRFESPAVRVFILPDTIWARRVSGVASNHLANTNPGKAHAVLSRNEDNSFQVSIRSPLDNKQGADEFCSRFLTGGGRKSAAGINYLLEESLDAFIQQFDGFYGALARQ
jgi:hypothetical protein